MRTIDETMPPFYLIISNITGDEKYSPILYNHNLDEYKKIGTVPHLLDIDLIKTFYAILISLHFPRCLADYREISGLGFKKMQQLWLGQRIVHIPENFIEPNLSNNGNRFYSVVFFEDILKDKVLKFKETNPETLFVSFRDINPSIINEVWKRVADSYNIKEIPTFNRTFFSDIDENFGKKITTYFTLHHLGQENEPDWNNFNNNQIFKIHHFIQTIEIRQKNNSKGFDQFREEAFNNFKIPLSLIAPGISRKYLQHLGVKDKIFTVIKNSIYELENMNDYEVEMMCLNLIATHEALAHNGSVLALKNLRFEFFQILDQIEIHCLQAEEEKGEYIWKQLKKLGTKITGFIRDEDITLILRASYINAYTKFPIGLSIFSEYSSPLAFIVPIVYCVSS